MDSVTDAILVVDDDDPIRGFLVKALQRHGFDVMESPDGADAVQKFEKHGDEIAMVLLDLGMPGMSGYETLAQLQIMDPDVKVVVVTGLEPDEEHLPGVVEILHKPVALDQLVASARNALES